MGSRGIEPDYQEQIQTVVREPVSRDRQKLLTGALTLSHVVSVSVRVAIVTEYFNQNK